MSTFCANVSCAAAPAISEPQMTALALLLLAGVALLVIRMMSR